ncbi:MAG: tetratricopeptide repeat protein [Silicimonas sp.]|nr:tetratricopeptide repeat protein [Silicimonas sp.]
MQTKRDPIAPFNLGNVQAELGNFKAARLSYQSAIARDPRFSEAHFNLAGVFESAGNLDAAADHLRQALNIDQSYAEAHFNLAHLALKADAQV